MSATGQPGSVAMPIEELLKARIVEFVRAASTEITPSAEKHLAELAHLLPSATEVYVAHPPNTTLEKVVNAALAVQAAGFTAVPHIVARRITYPQTLRTTLAKLRRGGVQRLLLVAGDAARVSGEFANTLDVLNSGIFEESGILRIDVAGYPEGQKTVGASLLWEALEAKQAFAARTGVEMHIVTQFGLNATAVAEWMAALARKNIHLPVHVGIAGPAPLSKLIKFAMVCGIGTSLRTVMHNLSGVGNFAELATSPDKHLMHLMDLPASAPVIAPHFFAFGGVLETARWIQQVAGGKFTLDLQGRRFTVAE
jgi:methylenetetrahydrofolate reductase (NADPH)